MVRRHLHSTRDLGIDLGTSNTIIYVKGKGIISNEASVVSFDPITGELFAAGVKAEKMIGRTHRKISAIKPIKNGIIDDFEATKEMLKFFINRSFKGQPLVKPNVLISSPMGITQIEKRAILEVCKQAGAQDVALIIEPVAAALGANLPVEEPHGNMVVNIGGGTSEVAIISLGGIVVGRTLRSGGNALNQAIIRGVRKAHNLEIGEQTAEEMKKIAGYAIAPPAEKKYVLKGKNIATGLPTILEIELKELTEFFIEPLRALVDTIANTLEKTPPDLASDILQMGITLAGGGALLKNLDKLISTKSKVPIHLAADPLNAVALGIGKVIEDKNLYQKLIKTQL
jgi:rod shape-determining protein MreB